MFDYVDIEFHNICLIYSFLSFKTSDKRQITSRRKENGRV